MSWFEFKTLKRSPDGGLLGNMSDSDMFEAPTVAAAKAEAQRRSRELRPGCVGLLLDANGRQLASFEAPRDPPAAAAEGAPAAL